MARKKATKKGKGKAGGKKKATRQSSSSRKKGGGRKRKRQPAEQPEELPDHDASGRRFSLRERLSRVGNRIDGQAFVRKKPGPEPILDDEEVLAELCRYIAAGNYVETAAALVGISKQTLYTRLRDGRRWERKADRRDQKGARSFIILDAVRTAMAFSEAQDVEDLRRHGGTEWFAIAWRLQRRWPKRWGEQVAITDEMPDDEMDQVDAELEEVLRRMAGDDDEITGGD